MNQIPFSVRGFLIFPRSPLFSAYSYTNAAGKHNGGYCKDPESTDRVHYINGAVNLLYGDGHVGTIAYPEVSLNSFTEGFEVTTYR